MRSVVAYYASFNFKVSCSFLYNASINNCYSCNDYCLNLLVSYAPAEMSYFYAFILVKMDYFCFYFENISYINLSLSGKISYLVFCYNYPNLFFKDLKSLLYFLNFFNC